MTEAARLPRRCCTALALGAAGHHGFELAAGAGLMLQRQLGLAAAGVLWGTVLPGLAVAAWKGSRRWDPVLALASGASLAAVAVHYTLWPWRPWPARRCGVPVLTSAEGLAHGHLPAYNAVLLGWGTGTLLALAALGPTARPWALAGFVLAAPMRHDARRHFEWIRCEAAANPAWWNRALQAGQ